MHLTAFLTASLAFAAADPPPPPAAAPAAAAAATGEVTEGKPAPEFDVVASDGTKLKLSALKGKPVVLFFYPKNETPGCTTEACSLRDAWTAFQKKGVVLIGVSADDDKSHKEFIDHHKLPFKLVSDPKGLLAAKYGVPSTDTLVGRFLNRQTVVIGADGNVKKIYRNVDVTKHAQELQGVL